MNLRRIINKVKAVFYFSKGKAQLSFSQFGEDIIVGYIFSNLLKRKKVSYLDIGTNDPIHGNNTYLFYMRGSRGVCIEPDPVLYKRIKEKRNRDVVLNAGAGVGEDTAGELNIFPEPYTGWNTFSAEEAAKKQIDSGIAIKEKVTIPFVAVNEIIQKYFTTTPDFISIDVEGLDLEIVKSINFDKYRPAVFCIETTAFDVAHKGSKNEELINFMLSNGYKIYADTFVNTLFIREEIIS
jgi:FkbM family methyltransferase